MVIFGHPTVHHFYEGLQFRAQWRHFSLKCLRMPSFCPKLKSSIKVMHRRMAKNGPKLMKICFSRETSIRSAKINFHEFCTIFDHPTMHHFYRGLQFRAKWMHSKAFYAKLPSLCSKLKSFIKVMHRRMAKNSQNFVFPQSYH